MISIGTKTRVLVLRHFRGHFCNIKNKTQALPTFFPYCHFLFDPTVNFLEPRFANSGLQPKQLKIV